MPFEKHTYLQEVKSMIDTAVARLVKETPPFKIYSVSVWTDPNAAVSAFNIDSRKNSEKAVQKLNAYFKKRHDELIDEGDLEWAELMNKKVLRNYNPADFIFRNFQTIKHPYFEKEWASQQGRGCWAELGPALNEAGEYAFSKISILPVDTDFELAVNSAKDWYDRVWKLS
jgi:hypothetical protein